MNIKIITASVRQGRIGPQISKWVLQSIQEKMNNDVEIIDLKEWYLPLDDEPYLPATGKYLQHHTQQWSQKIASGDLFVFVFPQYNWGYPASLKNAVDHLYAEWNDKVALIVSYANRGGGKAADQFQQIITGLHMHNLSGRIEVKLKDLQFNNEEKLIQPSVDLQGYQNMLYDLICEAELLLNNPNPV
ncbi:NAD(P)H-dependent oxidoreductase [Acinetobacter sp. B5B]|uniref:NADPH-dependent FMN reductase n=1 Tax=Acinetobacter baretiae TaxID=2605383 RepID=UPI0018C2A6DA|nr:NAD(P)H-dependent oxidoreductase [Acinetobacter baretiae]MBF7683300.1 NAD(P)H-dependent oxidoreductase [Acinetobacter baretiae]MBF7684492.1 NAD(P)H-dependent oxidoreductase [Acinetobacter baretiae]